MEKNSYESEVILLGSIIRRIRLEKGMTQEHLSTLCDVDVRTIQRIEKGKQNLSFRLLFAIADALETRPDILISKIFHT